MSTRIEWAEATTLALAPPHTITDQHGSTNERPALVFDTCAIEGSRDELRAVALAILAFTDE